MFHTAHQNTQSALATPADHFVQVGNVIHAFLDEDECWGFHQFQNIDFANPGSAEPTGRAKYFTRRELAAA